MKNLLFLSLLCLVVGCRKDDDLATPQDPKTETPKPIEEKELDRKEQFIRRMLNATLKGEEKVDVSDLNISETRRVAGQDYLYASDLEYRNWYDAFKIQYPHLFHLDYIGEYSRQYKAENPDEVKNYIIGYAFQPHKTEFYYQEIEKSLERYYADLKEGMNEADIAYALYNRLIKEVEYREDGLPFHAVGALAHQKAVCEGYSSAYRLLMNLVGIETQMVISGILPNSSIAHAWNRVKIQGEWYNVDATWDDAPKTLPFTLGKYFLTSDQRFHQQEKHPHALDYYQIPPANSTRFDRADIAFFRHNRRQTDAFFHQGYWYYINRESHSIFKAKIGETPIKVKTISPRLTSKQTRIAFGQNKIYYIDFDTDTQQFGIYSVDYNGNNTQQVRTLSENEVETASLNGNDHPVARNYGNVALRKAMALAKLKEAYYHGTEDYFKPENAQRIALLNTIKQAENLLRQSSINEAQADALAKKLENQRKGYTMGFSGKR